VPHEKALLVMGTGPLLPVDARAFPAD